MADVGIVMPVYKQDPVYLQTALRSVLNQSYVDFRLVIVVDGAPDDTINVIKEETKNDPRVRIIIKKVNRGVAAALNFGFELLKKKKDVKYFTWVSSDNIYYPQFIEKLRNALAQSPQDVGLVYSSFIHIDEKGDRIYDVVLENFKKYQEQPKENLLDACFIGVSFMYRKEYAVKAGDYELEPVEDYDYWLRLTDYCDIKFVPSVLMEYRKNSPLSISAKLQNSQSEHRRYRHAMQLAKYKTRQRRNIPPEVTILFPVSKATEDVVNKLESVLEQSYSNYELMIIDISEGSTEIEAFKNILDPRIKYSKLPGLTINEAIKAGLKAVNTPYTLVCGEGRFPVTGYILYSMVLLIRQFLNPQSTIDFVSIQEKSGQVQVRVDSVSNEPVLGELYKTSKLTSLLGDKE
ncbi:glycosyltransferase family 2 protein [Halalkalibacter urbisdiaboli]|uniref:glycosyltransferase family 2 protein n=1 Tax=Halalkalibacter urbisdiaboli TaxID=1960589 RepID=UPI000B44140C|nr:glycosyltransferase [Halalkalibacter urbisdiaboli]